VQVLFDSRSANYLAVTNSGIVMKCVITKVNKCVLLSVYPTITVTLKDFGLLTDG
jgi:hypothetical protein